MNEYLSTPPHPEQAPDIALFSLYVLYQQQPVEVRKEHTLKLKHMTEVSKTAIKLWNLEMKDRAVGLENYPDNFGEFHEAVEELGVPDDVIAERIDLHRDRILTLLVHRSLATRRYDRSEILWAANSIY